MSTLTQKLSAASVYMSNLSELPGYNGSILCVGDDDAAALVKVLDDAIEVITKQLHVRQVTDDDIERALNSVAPGGAQVKAWLPMLDYAQAPHPTARTVIRVVLNSFLDRLKNGA